MINENLLSIKYKRYKRNVLNDLINSGFDIAPYMHEIDAYVRDFYLDDYPVEGCTGAIKDEIRRKQKLGEHMNIKERLELAEAKRVAREAGYTLRKINEKAEKKVSFKTLAEKYGFEMAIDNAISEATDVNVRLKLLAAKTVDEASQILGENSPIGDGNTKLKEICETFTRDGFFEKIIQLKGFAEAKAFFLNTIKPHVGHGISENYYKNIHDRVLKANNTFSLLKIPSDIMLYIMGHGVV